MKICCKYPRELLHYDNQLKKKCLRKLKDNVWENKIKWKLLLKAECFHNFKLLLFCFRGWLIFARGKLKRRVQILQSKNHYADKTKRKVFDVLKHDLEKKWKIARKLRKLWELKIMRRSWQYWEKYVRKTQKAKEVSAVSEKAREMYLIKNFLDVWFTIYTKKKVFEKKYQKATIYHNKVIIYRAMNEWENYARWRKKERQLVAHSIKTFQMRLKRRVFNRLFQYMTQKKLYRKHVQCVKLFYENYLIKTVLDKWNSEYESLLARRGIDKNCLAIKLYNKNLLAKCFKKLRIWVEKVNARTRAAEAFVSISVNIKIQFYLELWNKNFRKRLVYKSMEAKADVWRSHQLKKAYITKMVELLEKKKNENKKIEDFMRDCNNYLMGRAFNQWLNFLEGRRLKKVRYQEMRLYHENKMSRKFFRALQNYTAFKIRKKFATNCYEKRLITKSIKCLQIHCKMKSYYRTRIIDFQYSKRRKILQNSFDIFKRMRKNANDVLLMASALADDKAKKTTFEKWKKYHNRKRQTKMLLIRNRSVLHDMKIKKIILIWWENVQILVTFKAKLKVLKMNQEFRLIKKHFGKWLDIIEKFRMIREKCLIFNKIRSQILFRYYFFKFAKVWENKKDVREKYNYALILERVIITRTYLRQWVAYIKWKKEKLRSFSAKTDFLFFESDLKSNYCDYTSKSKRKQPMIPLYLREELHLPVSEGKSESNLFQCFSLDPNVLVHFP